MCKAVCQALGNSVVNKINIVSDLTELTVER